MMADSPFEQLSAELPTNWRERPPQLMPHFTLVSLTTLSMPIDHSIAGGGGGGGLWEYGTGSVLVVSIAALVLKLNMFTCTHEHPHAHWNT